MTNKLFKALPVAMMLALAAGCATNAQLDEIKSMAADAQKTANEANQKADNALQTSQDAQRAANQALQTANDAKEAADAANSKVDRAFKKSMYK